MPKFERHHIIWIAIILIAVLYIAAPASGVTLLLRQFFHVVLSFLLTLLG